MQTKTPTCSTLCCPLGYATYGIKISFSAFFSSPGSTVRKHKSIHPNRQKLWEGYTDVQGPHQPPEIGPAPRPGQQHKGADFSYHTQPACGGTNGKKKEPFSDISSEFNAKSANFTPDTLQKWYLSNDGKGIQTERVDDIPNGRHNQLRSHYLTFLLSIPSWPFNPQLSRLSLQVLWLPAHVTPAQMSLLARRAKHQADGLLNTILTIASRC